MRTIFFFFTYLSCLLPSLYHASLQAMTLKERLVNAESGSYLVFEQNKNYTFFHVYENTGKKIFIEEVSIPANRFCVEDLQHIATAGFRNWFECGALHHTSWTMALINLQNGLFEEMYSFTQKGWIDVSKMDSFMTTLFNLSFEEIPEESRRHIGLPPGRSKPDTRPLWQPRLVVNGTYVPNVYFTAWKARWPADSSELSRKIIELYIPQERTDSFLPPYPTYFPYVIEVEGKIGSAKIRVVDSGMCAHSPMPRLPLRPPQLMGTIKWHHDQLLIHLKAPLYFEDFVLLAEEEDTPFSQPITLPFNMSRDGEAVTLSAYKGDLQTNISYRLIITPKDHPLYCLETEPLKIP